MNPELLQLLLKQKEMSKDHLSTDRGLYAVWLAKKLGVEFPKPSFFRETLLPLLLGAAAAGSMGSLATIAAMRPEVQAVKEAVSSAEVGMHVPDVIDEDFARALK